MRRVARAGSAWRSRSAASARVLAAFAFADFAAGFVAFETDFAAFAAAGFADFVPFADFAARPGSAFRAVLAAGFALLLAMGSSRRRIIAYSGQGSNGFFSS